MRYQLFSHRLLLLPALAALAAAGCKVGPNYARPEVTAPPAYRGSDGVQVSSENANSLGDREWAAVFRDPELQDLIRTALSNNYDLRIAARRVLEAEAQVRITRAQQFPQVTVGGTGVGAQFSPQSFGSGINIDSPLSFGSLNLSAAWTPDFWGLYRRQTEAARAQMLAQAWAQRAVRVTLVAEVASTWIELRALDRQLEIARQAAKIRGDSVDLTRTLASGGGAPESDVRQAEQLLYTATSQIPEIEQAIQQNENAMRLLLGEDPGPVKHTSESALAPVPDDLPTGLPSALLERRPDIQEAEAELRAANAQIGVARAQFFPNLAISGSGGTGGGTFASLVDSSSWTSLGIGTLTQPIFEGGRLRGQLQLSREQQQELVLNYRKTILGAFRDVSNALIAVKKERQTREEQEKLVAAAADATRLARVRYQGGATSYLEVLTTDSTLFTAQLNLATARQNEALTLVELYSALGGGWQQ